MRPELELESARGIRDCAEMDLADDRVVVAYIRPFIALKTRAAMGNVVEAAPVMRIIEPIFVFSHSNSAKTNYDF